MMGDFKILVSVSTATLLLLLQVCRPVASRPSGGVEGADNYPASKDYYALQNILGKHLGGTSTEKAKVIDLLLQLLEEIDLPTLCEVIVNDTKGSNNAFLQVPIKSTKIDVNLLNKLDSQMAMENLNNEATLQPSINMAGDKTTSAESHEQMAIRNNDEENNAREDATKDNKYTPPTYKYHTDELKDGELSSSQERQYAKEDSFNNVNYPEVLSSSVLSSGSNKENPSTDISGKDLLHDGQMLYSSFLKDKTASVNDDENPGKFIGDLKQLYLRSQENLDSEGNDVLSGYTNDVNQKNILVKHIDVERPRAQLFSQSLVLGDWMNKNRFDRNFLTTYTDSEDEVKAMDMPSYENNVVTSDVWSDNVKSDYKILFDPTKQQQQKYARGYLDNYDIVGQMLTSELSTPPSAMPTEDRTDSSFSTTPSESQRQVDYLEELRSTLKSNKPITNIPTVANDTDTSLKNSVESMAMFPQMKTKSVSEEYENAAIDSNSNEAAVDKQQQVKMFTDYSTILGFMDNNDINTIDNNGFNQENTNWIDASYFLTSESRPTGKSDELPYGEQSTIVSFNTTPYENTITTPSYLTATSTSYLTTDSEEQMRSENDNKTVDVSSSTQFSQNLNEMVTEATATFNTTVNTTVQTGDNEVLQATSSTVQEQLLNETAEQNNTIGFQQQTSASNLPQWAQSLYTNPSETDLTIDLTDSVLLNNTQLEYGNNTAFLDSHTALSNVTFLENGPNNNSTTMDYPQMEAHMKVAGSSAISASFVDKIDVQNIDEINVTQTRITDDNNATQAVVTYNEVTQAGVSNNGVTSAGITNSDVTQVGITNSDVTQAGASNNDISSAGITNSDVTQAGASNNDISSAGITNSDVTQAGASNNGVTSAGITNSDVTQAGASNNDISSAGITNSDVTQAGVSNNGVTSAGITNSDVAQAGVSNNEVTQAEVSNNEVTSAGITNSDVAQAGVSNNEVTQAEVSNNEVTQAGISNNEVTQAEVSNNEVTSAGITNSDVTQVGITNSDVTQAGVSNNEVTDGITNSNVTQAEVSNNEVTSAGITNSDFTQVGITNSDVTQAGVSNNEVTDGITNSNVTQAEVSNNEVTSAGIINSDVTQAEVSNNEVTSAGITNSDVTQAEVSNNEVTQAGVTNSDDTQTEVSSNEVTKAGVTHNDIISTEVTNSDITQAGVTDNGMYKVVTNSDITQAEVTNNVTQDGVENNVTHPGIGNNNATEAGVTNNDVTHPGITNNDATEAGVTNNDITQAEVTNNNVTHAGVTNNDVTHEGVSNNHMTHKDVTNVTQQSPEFDATEQIQHTSPVITLQADYLLSTQATSNATILFSMNTTDDVVFEDVSASNGTTPTTGDDKLNITNSTEIVQAESALLENEAGNKTMSMVNSQDIARNVFRNIELNISGLLLHMINQTHIPSSAYSNVVGEITQNQTYVSADTAESGIQGDVNNVSVTTYHNEDQHIALNLVTENDVNTTSNTDVLISDSPRATSIDTSTHMPVIIFTVSNTLEPELQNILSVVETNESMSTRNDSMSTMNQSMSRMNQSMSTINQSMSTMNESMSTMNESMSTMNESMGTMNQSMSTMNQSMSTVNESMSTMNMSNDVVSAQNVVPMSSQHFTFVQPLNETLDSGSPTVEVTNATIAVTSTAFSPELSVSIETKYTKLDVNTTLSSATQNITEDMTVPSTGNIFSVAPKFVLEKTADFDHLMKPTIIDYGNNRMDNTTLEISIQQQASETSSGESTSLTSPVTSHNDTQVTTGQQANGEVTETYNITDTEQKSSTQATISFLASSVSENETENVNDDVIELVTLRTSLHTDTLSQVLRRNITTDSLKMISSKIAETKANLSRINMDLLKPLQIRIPYEDMTSETPRRTETTISTREDRNMSTDAQVPANTSKTTEELAAFTSQSPNVVSTDTDDGATVTYVVNTSTTVNPIESTESTSSVATVTAAAPSSEVATPTTEPSTTSVQIISSTITTPSDSTIESFTLSSTDSTNKLDDLKDFTQSMLDDFSGTFEYSNVPNSDNSLSVDKTQFSSTPLPKPGNWAKVYDFPGSALKKIYQDKPSNRPYMSGFSDDIDGVQLRTKPVLDSWKAYNIALGKSKTRVNNPAIIDQSGAPEIHLYSNYRYTPAPVDNLRNYLWQARPWPQNVINNLGQGAAYNSMLAGKPELYQSQNIDMSNSVNYQTKTFNKIDSFQDQVKKIGNAHIWGNRFSQGYYGRVFDDQSNALNADDSTPYPTFHSREMVNFDRLANNLKYFKGYNSVQNIKNKYNINNLNRNLGMKSSDSFDLNQRYRDLMKTFPLHHNPELDQEKHRNVQTGLIDTQPEYSATWRDNTSRHEAQIDIPTVPETDVVAPWSTELPTKNGVPAPKDYTCPGLFGYHKDPKNCQAFFICSWGMAHRVICPPGTLYNSKEAVCDWAANIRCTVTPDNS